MAVSKKMQKKQKFFHEKIMLHRNVTIMWYMLHPIVTCEKLNEGNTWWENKELVILTYYESGY